MSAPLVPKGTHRLVEEIRQSGPVDTSVPYDETRVAGKTILITGAASGLGAAFARKWASLGANLILGDINVAAGEELVAELRTSTSNPHHFFQHCDVTDWQSQVELFQAGVRASPTGGIDVVVPNAGIADYATPMSGKGFENPAGLDADHPPPPKLKVLDVNIQGVFYTVHLGLFWLQRNGGSDDDEIEAKKAPPPPPQDRHILFISSLAGLFPVVGQTQYVASKHAVTGLFRTLRCTSWRQNVRINMICPYYVDTGINPPMGLSLLAGVGTVPIPDVVDAATRLVADEGIVGRSLVVGPRMRVEDGEDGEVRLVRKTGDDPSSAVWECYAHDYDMAEPFTWSYTRFLNTYQAINGWVGWARDLANIWLFRTDPRPKKRTLGSRR